MDEEGKRLLWQVGQSINSLHKSIKEQDKRISAIEQQLAENNADLLRIKTGWRAILFGGGVGGFVIAQWDKIRSVISGS